MKRRQISIVELEPKLEVTKPDGNPKFIENLQNAVLLTLLERKLLSEWQVELSLDELKKSANQIKFRKGDVF